MTAIYTDYVSLSISVVPGVTAKTIYYFMFSLVLLCFLFCLFFPLLLFKAINLTYATEHIYDIDTYINIQCENPHLPTNHACKSKTQCVSFVNNFPVQKCSLSAKVQVDLLLCIQPEAKYENTRRFDCMHEFNNRTLKSLQKGQPAV